MAVLGGRCLRSLKTGRLNAIFMNYLSKSVPLQSVASYLEQITLCRMFVTRVPVQNTIHWGKCFHIEMDANI